MTSNDSIEVESAKSKVERVVTLSEVAELNPRVSANLRSDALVSFVPMAAVSEKTASVITEETRVASDCMKGFTPFKSNDVLVAKITPCFENGKIVIANIENEYGFGSTEFHVIRPKDGVLHERYLLHCLRQPHVRLQGQRRMTGSAGQRRVPTHFLSTFALPLPTFKAQRRIASILDRAEALRAKRRAALALLDELTQSIFLDMFGDVERNDKGWDVCNLGDEVKLQGGYAFKSSDYTPSGIRLVKISNVHKDCLQWDDVDFLPTKFVGEYDEYSLSTGDIVLALTRPIIKSLDSVKVATVQDTDLPCLLNQRVGRFQFPSKSRLTPRYVLEFCRTKMIFRAVKSFCSESLQPNMSTKQVESVKLPLPPIDLQSDFARRVTCIMKLRAANEASLKKDSDLFAFPPTPGVSRRTMMVEHPSLQVDR